MEKLTQFLNNGDVVRCDGRNATVVSVEFLDGIIMRVRLDVPGLGILSVIAQDDESWEIVELSRNISDDVFHILESE